MEGGALFRKAGLAAAVLWNVLRADPVSMTSIQTLSQGILNWQGIVRVGRREFQFSPGSGGEGHLHRGHAQEFLGHS